MNKLRKGYEYVKAKYALLSLKKYTTLAGTLVFFFIMSIMPLAFWLTLLIGKLPIDTKQVLSLPVFASVKNVLAYVEKEAKNATAGASILLLFTTLYSATNLFYQIRRSGEIIYEFHAEQQSFRLRLGALVLLIIVMVGAIAFLLVFAVGSLLFSKILSSFWEKTADYALLALLAFFLVLLLNMYICPYKEPLKSFLKGTWLTVVLWAVAVVGFSVYLQISNVRRLYGALSTIIVFLLWLYILMICFIAGVIINSEKILSRRTTPKKRRTAKARTKKRKVSA